MRMSTFGAALLMLAVPMAVVSIASAAIILTTAAAVEIAVTANRSKL